MEHSASIKAIDFLKRQYGSENFTRWTTDSLETVEDLSLLFDLISKFKDYFEYPPVLTANFVTHNIDYNNSDSLSFLPLSSYLIKEPELVAKYREGIKNKILLPQLHGYCHYDTSKLVSFYSSDEGKELFKTGFLTGKSTLRGNLGQLRSELTQNNVEVEKKLKLAINEFYNLFNYYPISIVPPHFILDKQYFKILCNSGIQAIQASSRLMDSRGKRYRKIYFRKNNGFLWVPRNARLDPHPDYNFYSGHCISDISRAFKAHIPAVIDFHRVNISGRFNSEYRDKSLDELDKVLKSVINLWPETKFITILELIQLCQTTTI